MKICIIFRSNSKGRRIKKSEIARYDNRVAVLWQKKAWADRVTCLEWAKGVYRRGTSRSDGKVLFMDNLDGQTNAEFVTYLKDKCETKAWYGPAGCTDHWQPVDSHIGFMLKQLIVAEYEQMMEERGDEWEDGKISVSEKRVFVTRWVARAWEVMQTKYAHLIKKAFTRTGCGLTLDGSEDHLVHPEAFPEEYHTLLSHALLPEEYFQPANEEQQHNLSELQRLEDEALQEIEDAAAISGAMAEEEEEEEDADSPDALNEDEDYSSSDEPEDQQIFNFKGVVGIRKHGSSRKWYIEWYSEDCNSSDDQFDWVDLVEDLTKYEGQTITLLSPGSKIKVKWAASSSSIAQTSTRAIFLGYAPPQ